MWWICSRAATGWPTKTGHALLPDAAPGANRAGATAARSSWARTATTCKRKFSSSRVPSPTRWTASSAIVPELFDGADGNAAWRVFKDIDRVLILACGTSYYSGCTAKYWLESIAGIPCSVEVASEYRYRTSVPEPRTLVVTISQSGETADTLAALRHAQSLGMTQTLTICNVATSAMVRECKLALHHPRRGGNWRGQHQGLHHPAGRAVLADAGAGADQGPLDRGARAGLLDRHAPPARGPAGRAGAGAANRQLGRRLRQAAKTPCSWAGACHYPIALEGALKLKEISYIHAEAYPAGELKHGPLALVDRSHAGGDRGAQRCAAGKAQEQHAGSARARRRALCAGRCRHAASTAPRACT